MLATRYYLPHDIGRCPKIVRYLARIAQRNQCAMQKGDPGWRCC
jgi:glutathione S-transferase